MDEEIQINFEDIFLEAYNFEIMRWLVSAKDIQEICKFSHGINYEDFFCLETYFQINFVLNLIQS